MASGYAKAHHLTIGATLTAQTTTATTLHLTVRGTYTTPATAPQLGDLTITTDLFDSAFTTPGDRQIYLTIPAGPNPTAQAAIARALAPHPTAQLQTIDEFAAASQAPIDTILNLFYILLALSILISLLGILNTLILSITERTREIGVLRAIGMTRTQLTRMIRVEGEIIAVIGAGTGIAAGLLLAAVATRTLSTWNIGYRLSWTTLAVLTVVAFLAGTLAGIPPARRAARLDPLTALSYE